MKTELFEAVLTPCEWKQNYFWWCWHHVNENGTILTCADTMWMKTELFSTCADTMWMKTELFLLVLTPCEWKRNYLYLCWHHVNESGTIFLPVLTPCEWKLNYLKQRLGNRQQKRPKRRLPQNNDSETDNWNDPYDGCRKTTTRKPTTETTHTTVAAKQRLGNRQLKRPIRRLPQNNDSETDNRNDPYGCRKTTTRKSTTETTHTTVAAKQRLGNRQLKRPIRRLLQNKDSETDNRNDPYDGCRKTTTRKPTTETTHTTVAAKQRLGNRQLKRPIRLPQNNDSEIDNWNDPYDGCRKTTTRKPTTEMIHTIAAKQRLGNRQLKRPIRRLPQNNDSEIDNWNDPYDGCRKTTTRKSTTETTVASKQRLGNRQLKLPIWRLTQNNDSEIDNWNDPYDGWRKTTTWKSTTETTHTTVAAKQRLRNRQLKRPIRRLLQNNDSETDNWNDPYDGCRKTTSRKPTTETTHTTVAAKQRLGNWQLKRPIRRLLQNNDSETDNWNDPYDGCRKTTTRKPTTETTHTIATKQRLGNRQLKRPIRRLPQNNDSEIDNWNDPYDCRKTTTRKSTTETTHTTVAAKQRLGNRQLKRPIRRLPQNNDSEIDNWNDGWRKTTTRKSTTETTHTTVDTKNDSEIDNWNYPYDGCRKTTTRKSTTETTHTTVAAKQRLGNRQLKRPIWLPQNNDSEIDNWNDPYDGCRKTTTRKSTTETTHTTVAAKQRLGNRQLKWRLPKKKTTRKSTTETTHTTVDAKQRLGNRQLKRPIRRLTQNNDSEIDNWNDPYDGCPGLEIHFFW